MPLGSTAKVAAFGGLKREQRCLALFGVTGRHGTSLHSSMFHNVSNSGLATLLHRLQQVAFFAVVPQYENFDLHENLRVSQDMLVLRLQHV